MSKVGPKLHIVVVLVLLAVAFVTLGAIVLVGPVFNVYPEGIEEVNESVVTYRMFLGESASVYVEPGEILQVTGGLLDVNVCVLEVALFSEVTTMELALWETYFVSAMDTYTFVEIVPSYRDCTEAQQLEKALRGD